MTTGEKSKIFIDRVIKMSDTIFVLYVEVWGGTSYESEIIEAYSCPYRAESRRKELQGGVPKADCCYYVKELPLES